MLQGDQIFQPHNFLASLGRLLLFTLLGAIILGSVLFISSKIIYFLFLSPFAITFLAAAWMRGAVYFSKIHTLGAATLCGLLMGAALYGVFRYAEYWDFLRISRNELREEMGLSDEMIDEVIPLFLEEEGGNRGFLGFIGLQAQEGLSFTSSRANYLSGRGEDFSGNSQVAMLYWLIEIFIIVRGTTLAARQVAQRHFCEDINDWLQFNPVGMVPKDQKGDFLEAIRADEVETASQLVTRTPPETSSWLELHLARCHAQAERAWLRVYETDKENQRRLLLETRLTAEQYQLLHGDLVS